MHHAFIRFQGLKLPKDFSRDGNIAARVFPVFLRLMQPVDQLQSRYVQFVAHVRQVHHGKLLLLSRHVC